MAQLSCKKLCLGYDGHEIVHNDHYICGAASGAGFDLQHISAEAAGHAALLAYVELVWIGNYQSTGNIMAV